MPPTFNVGPGAEELEKIREAIECLSKGGVDVSVLESRLAQEEDHLRTKDVMELAEEYGKSCAYVNHEQLFVSLSFGWLFLQTRLASVKKDMYRRIRVLEADQKADPNVVEAVKRNRDMMEKLCAEVNQHATKMRVIRQQYEYEGQAALQEQQEAEQRKMLAEMGINL